MEKLLDGIRALWQATSNGWHRFKVWYKGLYKGRPWYMRTLIAIATMIVCFILFLIAVDIN